MSKVYRLKAGTHAEGTRVYKAGDLIVTKRNLCEMFPNHFTEVSREETSRAKAEEVLVTQTDSDSEVEETSEIENVDDVETEDLEEVDEEVDEETPKKKSKKKK